MAPYVLKIKYGEILRRVTVETSLLDNGPDLTFNQLEETIRQAFKIPAASELVVTYTDKDNDVVTMAGDHDLHDACVLQGLNPLRLTVTVVAAPAVAAAAPQESQRPGLHGRHGGRWHGHHHHGRPQTGPEVKNLPDLKNFLSNTLKLSQENLAQVMEAWGPLIKGQPKAVVSDALGSLMKAFTASGGLPREESELPMGPPPTAPPPHFGQGEHPMPPPPCHFGQTEHAMPPPPHFGSQFPAFPTLPDFPPFPHFPPFHCSAPEPAASSVAPSANKEQAQAGSTQEVKDSVQHRGVQCDACGMVPIVGTRYKSNKKHDYDLCQNCFLELGSAEDYTEIERSLWRPRHFHPQFSGGRMMRCPAVSYYGGRPFNVRGPHGFHGPYGGKGESQARCGGGFGGAGGKLDARFVQDVTIFDGTELSPGSSFTKIWRLRNSGSCAWPKSTQLIYVGGDELGTVFAVSVELPEEGLVPDGEVEVSVDLVAPERPGRYVSHWRLVSPTGQKFGHRVWVLIQVVPKDEQSPQMMESLMSSTEDMDVPEQEAAEGAQAPVGDVQQPMETDALAFVAAIDVAKEVKEPEVIPEIAPEKVQYPDIAMEALTLEPQPEVVEAGKSQDENTGVEDSELGNFSMVDMPVSIEVSRLDTVPKPSSVSAVTPRVIEVQDVSANTEQVQMRTTAEANSVESMLGTLESMGFKQRELNVELLKKNDYDLQRTLDDLVTAAEWDPMLEELEEMGFYDTDMNRRLMFKNNGSVKRVVKELVQMYKDPKGKEQM